MAEPVTLPPMRPFPSHGEVPPAPQPDVPPAPAGMAVSDLYGSTPADEVSHLPGPPTLNQAYRFARNGVVHGASAWGLTKAGLFLARHGIGMLRGAVDLAEPEIGIPDMLLTGATDVAPEIAGEAGEIAGEVVQKAGKAKAALSKLYESRKGGTLEEWSDRLHRIEEGIDDWFKEIAAGGLSGNAAPENLPGSEEAKAEKAKKKPSAAAREP